LQNPVKWQRPLRGKNKKLRGHYSLKEGRMEDALAYKGDEGRGVTAISFGEPSSGL